MAAHASGYEYDTRETGLYTFDTVMGVCCGDDDERVVQYCMLVGLLRANMDCPTCAQPMALKRQGTQWRCSKRACDVTLSVRHDSVFFHSKLPLRKLVKLLFFFATEVNATNASQFAKVSTKAVTAWYDICRGYCSKELMTIDMAVGGRGHVVEIDETSLAKKQKYHRGNKFPEFWVFGGYDRTTKKWFCAVTFDDRTKPTLTAKIAEMIRPETHIISDKFGSYVSSNERHTLSTNKDLKHMSYKHTWVNHSKNFVDPKTGAHTNSIEGCWEAKLKCKIKAMRGTISMEQVCAVVDECLWRSWFFFPCPDREELFKGMVLALKKHPVDFAVVPKSK